MGELTKKLKSHARRMYIPMIIAAALCSLLGLSILGGALITRMNEFKELNDYTEYQLQTGDYYKLSDFNIILDWFAEDDDGKYYLILRESDSKWMGLYLKSSADKKTAEKIIEDNDRYLNDETDSLSDSSISVKGRLRNMDSDEKQYFQEYLEASGYSSTELYEVADFRTLDTSDTNSGMLIAGILISAACLIWLFMSLRNLLGDGYVKKVQAKISERGMNPDHVAASLVNSKSFRNIDLTSMFAVLYGMDAELIPYDELVWVYAQVHTTVHKLYGIIPTGKSVEHKAVLVGRDQKTHAVTCKNEEESVQVIQYISGYAPYLLSGYSEEIANIAKANFAQIIQYVDQQRSGSL